MTQTKTCKALGFPGLFSCNLHSGPSAKKGIYGVLLNIGEIEQWVTIHCSTVKVVTPYDNKIVISHVGASGGGKSEMHEYAQSQPDGSLLIGRNLVNGEERRLTLPRGCDLRPVTDDMALCHPILEKGRGKLSLVDAEDAWFVRINHIGAWEVGFMPQWITREYLARRGGARFTAKQMKPSRCPLLGYNPQKMVMEGRTLGVWFFEVDQQPEVGAAAYDRGAEILEEFFHQELPQFLVPDLLPTGRKIIECCLSGGTLEDYESVLGMQTLETA